MAINPSDFEQYSDSISAVRTNLEPLESPKDPLGPWNYSPEYLHYLGVKDILYLGKLKTAQHALQTYFGDERQVVGWRAYTRCTVSFTPGQPETEFAPADYKYMGSSLVVECMVWGENGGLISVDINDTSRPFPEDAVGQFGQEAAQKDPVYGQVWNEYLG